MSKVIVVDKDGSVRTFEASGWNVSPDEFLTLLNDTSEVATYARGAWASVERVDEEEPKTGETSGRIERVDLSMLDAMNASYQAGRRDAIKVVAKIRESGDDAFFCDMCDTVKPLGDAGLTGSDGLVWCQDCHAEAS